MELQVFKNEKFGEIRTVMIDREPWFVGKDVAVALGYKDTKNALKSHVDGEDKRGWRITTPGGEQEMSVINESGLYALIFDSKLESANKFKHWVTSDILPTIRKTGGYINNDELFINTYLPFVDEGTKSMFRMTLNGVRKQNEIIEKQKQEIEMKNQEIKEKSEEIHYKTDVINGLVENIDLAGKRAILRRVINSKVKESNKFKSRWNVLYKEFEQKYHMNLDYRYKKYNKENSPKMKSKLDYIDKVENKLDELYEIATKLYESDVNKLIKEMYGVIQRAN